MGRTFCNALHGKTGQKCNCSVYSWLSWTTYSRKSFRMRAKTITWCNFAFQELLSVLTKMSMKFVFFQNRLYLRGADIQSSVLLAVTQWALQTSAAFDSLKSLCARCFLKKQSGFSSLKLVPRVVVR